MIRWLCALSWNSPIVRHSRVKKIFFIFVCFIIDFQFLVFNFQFSVFSLSIAFYKKPYLLDRGKVGVYVEKAWILFVIDEQGVGEIVASSGIVARQVMEGSQ